MQGYILDTKNRDRLIAVIENLPNGACMMEDWIREGEDVGMGSPIADHISCGTVGCIAGWNAIAFHEGDWWSTDLRLRLGGDLGLTDMASHFLCDHGSWPDCLYELYDGELDEGNFDDDQVAAMTFAVRALKTEVKASSRLTVAEALWDIDLAKKLVDAYLSQGIYKTEDLKRCQIIG